MIINIPAPEEARSYKDFMALFRMRNPGVDAKETLAQRCYAAGNHKAFYDWAWKQPEAEAIHAAYMEGMA